MKATKSLIKRMHNMGQLPILIVACVIVTIWWLETPAGLLGRLDAIGSAVCHRIDLRSFHLGIRQMPLCVRCTGQYIGAVLGIGFQALFGQRKSGFPSKWVIGISLLMVFVYLVDALNSYLYLPAFLKLFPGMPHLYVPSNELRLFTGTGFGIVLAMLIYTAFVGTLYLIEDTRPVISGLKLLFVLIICGAIIDLMILSEKDAILYMVAIISSVGVLLLLTMAYAILWVWIIHKENQYSRLSQAVMPILIGLCITISQLAVIGLLRFIITGTWNGVIFG